MARPATLQLYGLAMGAIAPLAPVVLASRARLGKEDAKRLGERVGRASVARPADAVPEVSDGTQA